MNRGIDGMRGLQGPDIKTAHTCAFGSSRMRSGALYNTCAAIHDSFAGLTAVCIPSTS